jgi:Flp pilus assembly secretin CpaC/outer membrane protein TolC
MKTTIRIGFVFLCLLLVGAVFLLLASRRHASLIADDQTTQNLTDEDAPLIQSEPLRIPVATSPGQILLHTVVMDIDKKKLAEAGIGLGDLGQKQAQPNPDQTDGQLKVVSRSEGRLLTKLLRTSGAAKILAEPTLVTNNGRPASFLSGGEIPILVPQGVGTTSVEYRRFGTSIDFTPKKQANGKLRLELRVEQTEVDHSNGVTINGSKVPALNTRQIDTAIELKSGQTAMLGELSGGKILVLVTPEFVAPIGLVATPVAPSFAPPGGPVPVRTGMDVQLLKGNSVVLEFTQKVPRVAVSEPGIAHVKAIAPDRLMVIATEHGSTKLSVSKENGEVQVIPISVPEVTAQPVLPQRLPQPDPPRQPPIAAAPVRERAVQASPVSGVTMVKMPALIYTFDPTGVEDGFDIRKTIEDAAEAKATATELNQKGLIGRTTAFVLNRRKLLAVTNRLSQTEGVALASRPVVLSMNGQPATVTVGRGVPVPNPNDVQRAATLTQKVGAKIDLVARVLGDGEQVKLEARADHSWLHDGAIVSTSFRGEAKLFAGETLALCQNTDEGKQLLFFVSPTVFDSDDLPSTPTPARPRAVPQPQAPGYTSPPAAPSRRRAVPQPQAPAFAPPSAPRTARTSPAYGQAPQAPVPAAPAAPAYAQASPDKRIPKGMRVVAVRPSEGSGGLTPGDFVDVISITLKPRPVAKTLLTGVMVFAVDANTDGSPSPGPVSLLVKQGDVEVLALQSELGKILLVPGSEDSSARDKWLSRDAAVAQTQLQELRSKFGPTHPKVQELKQRIDALDGYRGAVAKAEAEAEVREAEKLFADFEHMIHEVAPSAKVDARELPNGVLLSGSVVETRHVNVLVQIAEQYFPQVINNLTVAQQAFDNAAVAPQVSLPVKPNPIEAELRELREDVRVLRRDVSRLIEILEAKPDDATLQATPEDDDQSSNTSTDGDEVAWQLIGIRVEPATVNSGKFRGGLKVVEVRTGSPASTQGFRIGDVLLGLDMWETISRKNVHFVLDKIDDSGQKSLKFYVLRDGVTLFGNFQLASEQPTESGDAATEPVEPVNADADSELKLSKFEAREIWDLSRGEAISLGLQNSRVTGNRGGVTRVEIDGKKHLLLSRTNKDISLADFETAVQNLVSDTEAAYWDLWAARRKLDAAKSARDAAQELWKEIYEQKKRDEVGAKAESQAREQYFFFRDQLEVAMKDLYDRERKLRGLIGLAKSDGKLIRAADEPITDEYKIDWEAAHKRALSGSVELRRQRAVVKQRELELAATKKTLLPKLDVASTYKWYGAGDRVAADELGFDFNFPLGFRREAASVRNAELRLAREKAILEEMELNTSHLLSEAARDVDFNYQSAKTHFNRRAAAEAEVKSVASQFKSGKMTLDLVLEAQRRLTQSRIDYITALAQYATAIKEVHRLTGALLAEHDLKIEEANEPTPASNHAADEMPAIPDPTADLQPGDRLTIESLVDPKLNRHVTILEDGTITLPILGQVPAAGRKLIKLKAELEEHYRGHYTEPSLTLSFLGTSLPVR